MGGGTLHQSTGMSNWMALQDKAFFAEHPEMLAAADEYAARSGLVALKGSFTVASAHRLVGVIGAVRRHLPG